MSKANTLTLSEYAAVSNRSNVQGLESASMQTPQRKVKDAVNAERPSLWLLFALGEEIN